MEIGEPKKFHEHVEKPADIPELEPVTQPEPAPKKVPVEQPA